MSTTEQRKNKDITTIQVMKVLLPKMMMLQSKEYIATGKKPTYSELIEKLLDEALGEK